MGSIIDIYNISVLLLNNNNPKQFGKFSTSISDLKKFIQKCNSNLNPQRILNEKDRYLISIGSGLSLSESRR